MVHMGHGFRFNRCFWVLKIDLGSWCLIGGGVGDLVVGLAVAMGVDLNGCLWFCGYGNFV